MSTQNGSSAIRALTMLVILIGLMVGIFAFSDLPLFLKTYPIVRNVLEVLYFVAGIVIAIAAIYGLRQIAIGLEQLKITKQTATTNAQREAKKLAYEQCRYFADEVVPALNRLTVEYKRLGLTFLSNPPQYRIENNEIIGGNFDVKLWEADAPKLGDNLVRYLNNAESFAILFAEGVADDDLGFQETARAFCQGVQVCIPAVFHFRRINQARYESTVKLFNRWNTRLAAAAMAPVMKTMEEIIKAAEKQRVKTLGTEF